MCSQPENHEYAEEAKDALNIIKNIQESLEKEQESAQEIKKRFEILLEAVDSQISATESPHNENAFVRFFRRVFKKEDATAEKYKSNQYAEDVEKAIQMHMESIRFTQTHVEKLLKSDSLKDNKAVKEERHIPAQSIPYMVNPYEQDTSHNDMTKSNKKGAKMRQVVSLLYCQQKSELVAYVVEGLGEMLRKHLLTFAINLDIMFQDSVQEIPEDKPLIVICLHASRLGTDVSNAVKGIRTGPNVAVIVLHHKDIHALPSHRSNKILTAPEFQTIGAIIDMAFLSHKGFYLCDINQRATEALTSFLIRYAGV